MNDDNGVIVVDATETIEGIVVAASVETPEVIVDAPAEIKEIVVREGLNEQSGKSLIAAFAPFHAQIKAALNASRGVTDGGNSAHQKIARTCRLELRRVRMTIENVRKAAKSDALRYGKAVDGLANVFKFLCEPEEARLEGIEKHAERIETARIAILIEERSKLLVNAEADPSAYNLGAMDDATFAMVLDAATMRQTARVEADRKAEADRIAREKAMAEEHERVRVENARLKKEAEDREQALQAERTRIDIERSKERVAAKIERDRIEAQAKAERDAADKAAKIDRDRIEAQAKVEREAREKVEREMAAVRKAEIDRIIAANAAAEARTKAEREAADKAAQAPDKDAILAFVVSMRELLKRLPEGKTAVGKQVIAIIAKNYLGWTEWIAEETRLLV